MGVDWAFAGQVGGMGFGMVFFLLIMLAIIIRLTGFVISKFGAEKNKDEDIKKGA